MQGYYGSEHLFISFELLLTDSISCFKEFSLSDLEDGVKIPSKEDVFGKVSELTARYEEENEKIIQQINNHKVGKNI